jgi:chromosome segregation ATPase
MGSSIADVKRELELLSASLRDELNRERVDIESIHQSSSREVSDLRVQLEKEREAHASTKRQVDEISKENASLKAELERPPRQIPTSSQKNVQGVSSVELDTERRRRVKAEQELEMFRKQGKGLDEETANNARRVAIVLAQRCAELSAELERVRAKTGGNSIPADNTFSNTKPVVQVTKPVATVPTVAPPAQAAAKGWGLEDDDDLFASLS